MEQWQKLFINDNLPKLITSIRCDVILLAYLVQYRSLSPEELGRLNSMKDGEVENASELVSILQTRKGGFKHLAKALHECTQTGAFSILLKGIQRQALSKDVLFQGHRLPLEDLWKPIDVKILQRIISDNLDDTNYQQFLSEEPTTIAVDTIPEPLKYYIPRTLSINSQVDPKIFEELEEDIFCVEGKELFQLSSLSKKGDTTSDRSRNQIKEVTARFILLERHDHFQKICENSTQTVHWIKYYNKQYFYVKCSTGSGIHSIQKFLNSKNPENFSEDDFLEKCLNVRNAPVLLYDSPGMGKSVLLASLARKTKMNKPNASVIYFQMSELIGRLKECQLEFSANHINQVLVETITTNSLGHEVIKILLGSKDHQIYLFLDAFDELQETDLPAANSILDCVAKECQNIGVFITTRPHRRHELEEKLGVLGYNILPFDDPNKLSFFLKFWESELGVEVTDGIQEFAEGCLKTLVEMSSEEGDIAGIPLQCRMLADIFAEDAKNGDLIPTESKFQLNSIFQVYKKFIDTKFSGFCSHVEKQMFYDFHVREALRIMFPENCKQFYLELVPDVKLIYKIGILEPLKSDPTRPGFSHRTLAEYFASEFFATYTTSKFHNIVPHSEYIDMLFQQALQWSTNNWVVSNFHNPVICRFLNFFLSRFPFDRVDCRPVKSDVRESYFYNPRSLAGLLESSLRINAVHLYLFLLDVFLDLEEFCYKGNDLLKFKEDLQHTQNWSVKEPRKLEFVNDLKNNINLEHLVVAAAEDCSLNLVNLSCQFLKSVAGWENQKFDKFSHHKNPMYYALQRGHYQIFEYLLSIDREEFYEQPLLHWCLESSHGRNLGEKGQIVKRILHERPDLLNKPNPGYCNEVPVLARSAHFCLINILIEAGADLTQTTWKKENIAHTTWYFSAEEYHWLVEIIISRNAQIILKRRDGMGLTPVHRALTSIDLKSETLELLANRCNVTFNDKRTKKWGTELTIAIQRRRSERVIKDIIRLGGDKEKLDSWTCQQLTLNYNL